MRQRTYDEGQPSIFDERSHDLPPRWDDLDVTWEGWGDQPWSSAMFHVKPERCPTCRSTEASIMNRGRVEAAVALLAFRCPTCRRDEVLDVRSGAWWTLDPSDYEDEGSHAPTSD